MAATPRAARLLSPAATPTRYAGVVTRGIALALDAALIQGALLLTAAMLALIASLVGGIHLSDVGELLAAAAWLAATAAYFVAGWSVTGRTPGQRAMELAVTTADGSGPPGVARSIVRVIGLALCIVPVFAGFLPALFDARRRGLHDMLAGSVVVGTDRA